jgi:ssDNA thymidine ADP-ribosyltransferase, DarT
MNQRVTEFQCIMPLENIPSVLKLGILSNERAIKVPHYSVAMEVVQERRDSKNIPRGLKLHQYANLYFHARNPMLFKRKEEAANLCILRISTEVRHIEGVVIPDRNASSDYVRFLHPSQEALLNYDVIFAEDWRHPNDRITYLRHRSQKCAEVLVPHCIEPKFLTGAYVVNEVTATKLKALGFNLSITVDCKMFFH